MARSYTPTAMYRYGAMQKAGGAGVQSGIALGPELVPSAPEFDASEWTINAWTIVSGDANAGVTSTNLVQLPVTPFTDGTVYRIEFSLDNNIGFGELTVACGNNDGTTYTTATGPGTYTEDLAYGTTTDEGVVFKGSSLLCSLTSVSVKEVL